VHLNPVRIQALGLSKKDRQTQRMGLSAAPNADVVRQRLAVLRGYRWSSYRAYAGLESAPEWLQCKRVLALGGGKKEEQGRRYREYAQEAVREGVERSPWEAVREQVVLGGMEFLSGLRRHLDGDEQEQRGARRLRAERPGIEAAIAAVERVKGRPWAEFRDQHGDSGRDLVLYLGRRACGLKLAELAEAVGWRNYGVVATNVKRYEQRLQADRAEKARMKAVLKMLNCEM
jgi:hypothetical protein